MKNIHRFLFSFILISSFFLVAVTSCRAQESGPAMSLELSDLYVQNGVVKGNLEINNNTSLYYSQLYYSLVLLTPGTKQNSISEGNLVFTTSKGMLVSHLEKEFALDTKEKKTVPFSFPYNPSFPSGKYSITASVKTIDNGILGYETAFLDIKTQNNGFIIDPLSCEVLVNDISYSTSDGPVIGEDDKASVNCRVINTSRSTKKVKYGIEYAVRFLVDNPVGESTVFTIDSTFSFAPKEEKIISFAIPKVKTPQVFDGYVYILDEQGKKVSPAISFRWTVPGPSAHIEKVSLDKNSYKKGEKIITSVLPYPSMDLFWDGRPLPSTNSAKRTNSSFGTNLADATLLITIVDENKNVCATKEQKLPDTEKVYSWNEQRLTLTSVKDCNFPIVSATIVYEGSTIATVTKNIPTSSKQLKHDNLHVEKENDLFSYIIFMLVLVCLVCIVVLVIIKNKKLRRLKQTTTKLLLLWVSVFFAFHIFLFEGVIRVNAQEIVKSPINSPIDAQNLSMVRLLGRVVDTFYFNYSDFAQNNPSGQSSIIVGPSCNPAQVKVVGYGGSVNFCANRKYGLRYIVTIDNRQAVLSNVTSPESAISLNTAGPNSFDVWDYKGIRTGNFSATLPGGLSEGAHTIDLKVIAIDYQDTAHTGSFRALFTSIDTIPTQQPDSLNCNTKGKCYGKLSYSWRCSNQPPPTPVSSLTPTPRPVSLFNENMCQCDGMDFKLEGGKTTFFPGDKVTLIGLGKVEGRGIGVAEIQSMKITLYQKQLNGKSDTETKIAESMAITPDIIENTSRKVRYRIIWNKALPKTVAPGTVVRAALTHKCVKKPGVLGVQTATGKDYFTSLFDSYANLFVSQSVLSTTDVSLKGDQQHGAVFYPGLALQEKSCNFIKFYFN